MSEKQLLDAMSGIDAQLLQRSEHTASAGNGLWKKILPLAACVCLIVAAAWFGISGNTPKQGSLL